MAVDPFAWLADLTGDIWNEVLNAGDRLVARGGAENLAQAYHLDGDETAFRILWALTPKAALAEKGLHEDAQAEVGRHPDLLKGLADVAPTRPTAFGTPIALVPDDGFLTTRIAETAGRHAVFSSTANWCRTRRARPTATMTSACKSWPDIPVSPTIPGSRTATSRSC